MIMGLSLRRGSFSDFGALLPTSGTEDISLAGGVLKDGHSRETVDLILPVRDILYQAKGDYCPEACTCTQTG